MWAFSKLRRAGATLPYGARASHCGGFSLRSKGSRHAGSVVVAHRLSCSAACGIFADQGCNPCSLHWQADSNYCATREVPVVFSFILFFFTIYLFIYLWLRWVFVAVRGLSLVVARGLLFVAVRRLLIAVASLVAEHGL